MAERNSEDIEKTLDFFILQALSQEPLPGFVLERHLERIYKLLEFAAERKGKPTPPSLSTALRRLVGAGCLQIEGRHADSSSDRVYSLTSTGREQLQAQQTGWMSTLARFIDEGGLDDSFRKFLNRDIVAHPK